MSENSSKIAGLIDSNTLLLVASSFSVVLVVFAFAITFYPREVDDKAWGILRTFLALTAAMWAAFIPGLLKIDGEEGKFAIEASGALAVFLLVYFWNPAKPVERIQMRRLN